MFAACSSSGVFPASSLQRGNRYVRVILSKVLLQRYPLCASATYSAFSPVRPACMAYTEWGDPDNTRVLVCVHGLTRSAAISTTREACRDTAWSVRTWPGAACPTGSPIRSSMASAICFGHGHADRAAERGTVDWFGTSMGGMIGMGLAGQKDTPIGKMCSTMSGRISSRSRLARIGDVSRQARAFRYAGGRYRHAAVLAPLSAR